MLVFHQSKCISVIKRILFYYLHVYILEFIHAFVCSLSLQCMLASHVACGSEDVAHNKVRLLVMAIKILNAGERAASGQESLTFVTE